MFRQVEMRREAAVSVAWIPERFAIVGKFLRVEDLNGWLVTAVFGRISQDELSLRTKAVRAYTALATPD